MTVQAKAHAKHRPPSAAKRWLSCAASATIAAMYPNESSDASLKGDYEHDVMEDTLRWMIVPPSLEPDLYETMTVLLEYVKKRLTEMGPNTHIMVERTLSIPETGEFGTCDVALISDREIEVIDYKSGWVPVHVRLNPQLMVYLLGIIALHGERKNYKVTVYQPNYDHIDGPMRSDEPTPDDIEWLRGEIKYSMENDDVYTAGKHCKDTYCPHRGACISFAEYTINDAGLGWHTPEVNALSDDLLSEALDHAETLAGYRNELRSEAMRRIINMDRRVNGYKVVKGRKQRTVLEPLKVVEAIGVHLGVNYAMRLFPSLLWAGDYLAEALKGLHGPLSEAILKELGTPKQIEDVIKHYAKDHNLPRGGWKQVYDNVVGEYIRETNGGLTLERAIDGRPAHKKGSEFGALLGPTAVQAISII